MRLDYLRAFVLRGKTRKRIFEDIAKGERTPAQIHNTTQISRPHVRRALIELEEKSLVKCLNPKDRIYKMYILTLLGKKVKKRTDDKIDS